MAGTEYTVIDLVNQLNKALNIDFGNNKLANLSKPLRSAVLKEYTTDLVKNVSYPFGEFIDGLVQLTGSRQYQDAAKMSNFTIENLEWDKGYRIKRADFERAQSVVGLNYHQDQINQLQIRAIDHPVERAMLFLENGAASTYGTTFDGQCLFDTTHSFTTAAGTQSNIVTGTGETLATIMADVESVIAAMAGFYWESADGSKRLFNPTIDAINIICHPTMSGKFKRLQTADMISSTEANAVKGLIASVSAWPFTDADDWYATDATGNRYRPIIGQTEVPVEFSTPNLQGKAYLDDKKLEYGTYYRGNVGYGAWWSAVKVTNT